MKPYFLKAATLIVLLGCYQVSVACVHCNREIREAIFNSTFYPNLFVMLSPFLVLGVVVALLYSIATKRYNKKVAALSHNTAASIVPLTAAAAVCGIGIGGFIDGIVLHQILQWHEMISNKLPPTTYVAKSVNMFWDGVFHAFTLLVTLVGIILLWKLFFRKNINHSGYLVSGGLLLGWAGFNIIEGIADHHILKLHNVREITPNVAAWNYGFLGFSVLLGIVGFLLVNVSSGCYLFCFKGLAPFWYYFK